MSETENDAAEKSHDPTPQKLEDARKKGDIAKSTDLNAAAGYIGLLVSVSIAGAWAAQQSGTVLSAFLARADTLAPRLLDSGGPGLSLHMLGEALWGLFPLFALPFLAVLLSILGQQSFVVAPDKLIPKLSRISPIEGAKNKFGMNGIAEFVKATVKLCIIAVMLGIFLASETDHLIGLVRATPMAVPAEMMRIAIALLAQITVVALAIAAIDFLWQRYSHNRKLMMSFQEVKEEAKRSEGDPHMKAQRRQRGQEIANNRMMHEVPNADVVMVNPTHYAVALKWDRQAGTAPVVIAKGVDEIA
ncbi:MAG: flagellar type III secretion system protein FlhB, partial [Pseudomonadota bacterium]